MILGNTADAAKAEGVKPRSLSLEGSPQTARGIWKYFEWCRDHCGDTFTIRSFSLPCRFGGVSFDKCRDATLVIAEKLVTVVYSRL